MWMMLNIWTLEGIVYSGMFSVVLRFGVLHKRLDFSQTLVFSQNLVKFVYFTRRDKNMISPPRSSGGSCVTCWRTTRALTLFHIKRAAAFRRVSYPVGVMKWLWSSMKVTCARWTVFVFIAVEPLRYSPLIKHETYALLTLSTVTVLVLSGNLGFASESPWRFYDTAFLAQTPSSDCYDGRQHKWKCTLGTLPIAVSFKKRWRRPPYLQCVSFRRVHSLPFRLPSLGVWVHVKWLLNWNIDVEYQSVA